jgi:hypothetical protein
MKEAKARAILVDGKALSKERDDNLVPVLHDTPPVS